MLAALLLLPLLLVPQDDQGALERSGVSDRELVKICKDVQAFYTALDSDDRGDQESSLKKINAALAKAAKKAKVSDSMLRYLGDWDFVLESAKPQDRATKSAAGKGFTRRVFADPWDPEERRVVSLVSIPAEYGKQGLLPAVVALPAPQTASGDALETAIGEQATALYGDLLASHIVLIPLGFDKGGRKPETQPIEGSWFAPDSLYAFYTSYRTLLEELQFDRSRVILDGWGEAGLDALRLATSSPAFFAGVINRGGGVDDESAILQNLVGVPLLYVKGDGAPEDLAVLELDAPGVETEVLEAAGSVLEPSDETRAAVAEWIGARRRNVAPKELHFLVRELVAGSVNWVTATEINLRVTANPGDIDYPRLKAKVDEATNTIEFDTVNVLEMWVYLSDALVDMNEPVTIRVNGKDHVKQRRFNRDLRTLLEGRFFNNSGDYGLYTAKVRIDDIDPNVPAREDS